MLSDAQLASIMRNASLRQRQRALEPLNAAMRAHGIDTPLRSAAFLAQLAHESGELQFMEELWRPTPAQKRYEPPGMLAKRLGNTQPGDGKRFKGRGPIQITGRANYQRYGDLLGLDLLADPELAASPDVGFRVAGLFWERNGLNALADTGDFKAITRRINGGQTGAADRERYYERAKAVLASTAPTSTSTSTLDSARPSVGRSARAGTPAVQPPSRGAALPRGEEGIRADARSAAPPARPRRRSASAAAPPERVLNVRPDTLDFRDLMYVPTLVEVPTHVPLNEYLAYDVPVLDQGSEGACTGFGLATVANYLALRRRVVPDDVPVSPRMFYELARRYDEWPGEDYSGSSARGAMKGWHKHGVCAEHEHPYRPGATDQRDSTETRTFSALQRPLGAYFRVNHKDLVAMHAAIAEVGVLYATAAVHKGWSEVDVDGRIVQSMELSGGHAFGIVAYDDEGFWIQNSWGTGWGRGGFARVTYDDWLANGTDAWVARLGAPVKLGSARAVATAHATVAAQSAAYTYADLRPHIVSVGNDGALKAGGTFGSTPAELVRIFEEDIPRVTAGWDRPRILLYAHGGLTSEQSAVQRLAEYRPRLLEAQVYPLAFVWRTDYWTTVSNILADAARRRRPEGLLDATKDFLLDRLDDALEPLARALSGKAIWDEIKENALAASIGKGAMVQVADLLQALGRRRNGLEIHMVGHSAGSILHAPMVGLLAERKLKVATCTLWAPACTVALFDEHYLPALKKKAIGKLALFTLSDQAEQDDNCAGIYNKSLLYLVSDAFERRIRIPLFRDGEPILGMQRWHDAGLRKTFASLGVDVVVAPNTEPAGSIGASRATHHGDFDDDEATVLATYMRIARDSRPAAQSARAARAGVAAAKAMAALAANDPVTRRTPMFSRSGASLRAQRERIEMKTR